MKTSFIIPSWKYWAEPTRAQPLTQMYLATILEDEFGDKVDMVDLRDGPKEISKADIFFYTVMSPDFDEVKGIVKDLREKYPESKHVAGGAHPSIFPVESLKTFDSIVLGRGEEAIVQIVKDVENGELSQVCENIIPSEKEYPFPRRDFLPKEKIVTSLFKTEDIPSTTVLFSHGCPYSCSFCANYDSGPIQKRSLESISNEIDYLKENYKIKGLSLQDEICIAPGQFGLDFLDLMESKDVVWRGQMRAGAKREVIKRAKESGCLELSFGLESVDQHTLDLTRKRMNVELAKETLDLCKEYGIKTRLYLLNGLPGEPKNIVQKTKDFIEETNPDFVLLSTLQPYPGSEIYNNPEEFGIKNINKDFSKYNHLRCRFEGSEDKIEDAVPFEYEKGKGFSREQIMDNLVELQSFLRDRGANK